jgi:hypothetical protein
LGHLLRLHRAYRGRVAFLMVAITDAGHPGPRLRPREGGPRPEAATPEERLRQALEGLDAYRVPFPVLLDEGGQAERAYGAYPKRLVVVGADGRALFDGGHGPTGGPSDWDLAEVEGHLLAALRLPPSGEPPPGAAGPPRE